MAEAPGSDIGPYRIVAPIGTGGFATVYRARDDRLDSDVALKVLAENHSLDPDIRERFLGEAQLLRRIDSEAVVRVLDVGETERFQPYLVLEYADRGDLRTRMEGARASGRVPTASDVATVAGALAEGLRAVHAQGVVHRDVSPGNLLIKATAPSGDEGPAGVIASDERLVLADLGYAKDLALHSGLTAGGGTQGFCAPEQRQGASTVDQRADVYAASALLAWLGLGEEPGEAPARDPAGHLLRAGMEARLAAVLGTGLAAQPRKRQADVDRWHDEILAALTPSTEPDGDGAPDAGGNGGRGRLLVAVLAALLVGLVVGVGVTTWLDRDDRGQTTTAIGDGRVRVTAEDGGVAAALFGPAQLAAGETGTFEAGATGAAAFAWVAADGSLVEGAESIEVTPEAAGTLTIRLLVTGADGTLVTVSHEVTVTE
ncbi:serine/threonine-protein kinase [soil metagenome]